MLALQCGGSDGYSGITANPALGAAADQLVKNGGTAILSETPEIYGAEHLLTARAATREIGDKLVGLIRWWEDYTARNGGEMNNNPSPGNKAGGLTTILEKSLGAAAKGGTTPLNGVYHYAEPVTAKGFVYMDTPGYDPVSATGQVAGGANVLCFTTGRGSAYGCKPTPSIKLATNSETFRRMEEDMDINCGDVLDGVSIEDKGARNFRHGAAGLFRRAQQVGNARLRRRRICAVADRSHDVRPALLFDLDGTLVDSDAEHLVAFQKVFAPHGIALDHAIYTREIMGASNQMIGERFLSHLPQAEREAILDAKEATYRDGLGALVATRGAAELLAYAEAHDLPCAVVTNAPRANADKVLAAIGLGQRLKLRVIGGELARSKPDPLPYETALAMTGVTREQALAFEDSLSGIRAAVAAGIAVVGITTGLPAERLIEAGAAFGTEDLADPRIFAWIEAAK